MTASGLTDEEIIRRVLGGEVDLYEALIIRHRQHVGRIVKGHVPRDLVEEVTHEVFVRAYTSLPTYSFQRPFQHWLSTVAIRGCYAYGGTPPHARSPISESSNTTDDEREWTEQVLAAESRERFDAVCRQREATDVLQRALAQLSAENRMVVTLVHLEGHSVREAADLLGWTVVNVKVRAHRARHQLRKILDTLVKDSP